MARKRHRKGSRNGSDQRQVELLPDMVDRVEEGAAGPSVEGPDTVTADEVAPSRGADEVAPGVEREIAAEAPAVTDAGAGSRKDPPGREAPDRDVPEAPEVSGQAPARPDPEPAPIESPRPQGNQLARARDLVESGRIEDAIETYGEVLRENPTNLRALNNLGVLFDELGQHATALEHFEAALKIEPENVEVLTNGGRALTELARFEEAAGLLIRALRLAPDDPVARLAQGVLSFRRGLYAQAETELRWVCDREPERGEAFYYRAEALNRTGRFTEATELMLRASELLPGDYRPFYTLGHLYDRQSRPFEAAEMYRRARDLQAT